MSIGHEHLTYPDELNLQYREVGQHCELTEMPPGCDQPLGRE